MRRGPPSSLEQYLKESTIKASTDTSGGMSHLNRHKNRCKHIPTCSRDTLAVLSLSHSHTHIVIKDQGHLEQ